MKRSLFLGATAALLAGCDSTKTSAGRPPWVSNTGPPRVEPRHPASQTQSRTAMATSLWRRWTAPRD